MISLTGKSENAWFLGAGLCQRSPFLSHTSQSIELWAAWLGSSERLGEQQPGLWVKHIKGRWILLSSSKTPIRKPAHKPGDALPEDPLNCPTGSPSASCASPTYSPTSWLLSAHVPKGGKSKPLQIAGEHAQKAGLTLQKVHKLSIQHHSRVSKREAVNTWPDFAGTESYEIPRIREQEV